MIGPMGPCCRIIEQNQTEGYYPAGVISTAPLARGVTRWYVYDGLCSVVAEVDDNNNVTSSGQYDVYGAPRAGTQQGVAASSSQGYVGSLGHVTDASTGGLIYMQARYYDPSLGRFVSEDPGKCDANWYIYTGDSPVCFVDSSGKRSLAASVLAGSLWGAGLLLTQAALATMYCGGGAAKAVAMASNMASVAAACFGMALMAAGASDPVNWAIAIAGFLASVASTIIVMTASAGEAEQACAGIAGANIAIGAMYAESIAVLGACASVGADS